MDKFEKLKKSVEWVLEQIEYNMENIEQDCRENGGPMPAVSYTKLKVYKEIQGILSDALEEVEDV